MFYFTWERHRDGQRKLVKAMYLFWLCHGNFYFLLFRQQRRKARFSLVKNSFKVLLLGGGTQNELSPKGDQAGRGLNRFLIPSPEIPRKFTNQIFPSLHSWRIKGGGREGGNREKKKIKARKKGGELGERGSLLLPSQSPFAHRPLRFFSFTRPFSPPPLPPLCASLRRLNISKCGHRRLDWLAWIRDWSLNKITESQSVTRFQCNSPIFTFHCFSLSQ